MPSANNSSRIVGRKNFCAKKCINEMSHSQDFVVNDEDVAKNVYAKNQ